MSLLRRSCRLLSAASLLFAARLDAQALVLETGTPFVSSARTADFGTTGGLMNGMRITAYFGELMETASWGRLNAGSSGVRTDRFQLFHETNVATGTSFSWFLTNFTTDRPLTRLVLNGAPGRTVFDISLFPGNGVGTPGSSGGTTLEINSLDLPPSVLLQTVVTYRNVVAVAGSAPFNDLYEEVDLRLGDGLSPQRVMAFRMDTDNLPADATIVPGTGLPTSSVPEPATVALFASGLAGVAVVARRRRA